jgi:hypothetical protein
VPGEPAVVDAAPGAPAGVAIAPITLPVVLVPPAGLGAGAGPLAGPPAPPPAAPRVVSPEPPAGREPLPANGESNGVVPASSYRAGYGEYLRSAGLPEVAAVAVPGIVGMLLLTSAGGLVGYRQAKAGHAVRIGGTARFLN